MKKLLKKGGEWFTMEASGKKVVRSGTLWRQDVEKHQYPEKSAEKCREKEDTVRGKVLW